MEGTDLDDLINLEGTVRGTIFSGSNLGLLSEISLNTYQIIKVVTVDIEFMRCALALFYTKTLASLNN